MAKSKETFGKKEKEKKRLKQLQEKKEKMDARKANATKKSLDDMIAYVDENGNITSTPPDPGKKKVFLAEDMQISVPRYEAGEDSDEPRKGVVSFFNESKGFGFINDSSSGERIFIHINNLNERIAEGDKVSFDVENGPRGLSAVNVAILTA